MRLAGERRLGRDLALPLRHAGHDVILLIAIAPAAAQQGDLNAILKRYNELYDAGDYAAALVEAQKLEAW